ncbi:MAG: 4-hydroxy-3-methylbut-2-enyl diphosphate reductase [Bacteroidales bacterium]|jgi:4-hydroxy-3-methylbut-2-enyl diphosphate reductase|nr:4-hydroxy-3-methylbut-2-enyl diphosphate reductase [Bacteroidales bacterium]HOL97253.1 4-hydroxy-3-methylbut-2-enyl diphosphate reductase [Bacteroidales bacterium]HOM35545.1 4-hydroxy-3-methylbut-2-enyl diphosphate reductase [Bacteroidales bacterium]HPD23834.1 4-hydroxy-3-methylbut-2-enyl diphosphate reductase [Bacteroidales bacterium]HRS98758.1 4-hydroxy-3-methylbut-2-enyl diphosphate reductase [Bacteroidales bacterium]
MLIEIDKYAGFCFGVTQAIQKAETLLNNKIKFYCIGEIVHNKKEAQRLENLGMIKIEKSDIEEIKNSAFLIRAHGEPPETYLKASKNNNKIYDATCPVVIKLQQKIKNVFIQNPEANIIIFGKAGHPEVNGLMGQTNNKAIVVGNSREIEDLKLSNNVILFSQTTSDYFEYQNLITLVENKLKEIYGKDYILQVNQTICPSVKNRIPGLKDFCSKYDIIIFVSDYSSSNGKSLFEICKAEKPGKTFFITSPNDIQKEWLKNIKSIGITGATSTPLWLMEEVKNSIKKIVND